MQVEVDTYMHTYIYIFICVRYRSLNTYAHLINETEFIAYNSFFYLEYLIFKIFIQDSVKFRASEILD